MEASAFALVAVTCPRYPITPEATRKREQLGRQEKAAQADLLREIIGNPFSPVPLVPDWLSANDRVVVALARAIYDERAFERMPILGDALEDAGCDDATILNHCRQLEEHVRGCWLLDLILGLA
jgi:hypothetical protein